MRLGGSRFSVQFNGRINFIAMRENEETQNLCLEQEVSRMYVNFFLTDSHSPHY